MRVEDEAVSPTRSVDPGGNVEALGDHRVLLRREAVAREPLENELPCRTLAPGRAVDVPEGEGEVDDLLRMDSREDVVRCHSRYVSAVRHRPSPGRAHLFSEP